MRAALSHASFLIHFLKIYSKTTFCHLFCVVCLYLYTIIDSFFNVFFVSSVAVSDVSIVQSTVDCLNIVFNKKTIRSREFFSLSLAAAGWCVACYLAGWV